MLLYSKWLDLPIAMRIKVAAAFGIVKRGSTEVFNNTIKSDGYIIKEIESALSKPNLQNFTDTDEEDFILLWNMMLNKINGVHTVRKSIADEIPVIIPPTQEINKVVRKGKK